MIAGVWCNVWYVLFYYNFFCSDCFIQGYGITGHRKCKHLQQQHADSLSSLVDRLMKLTRKAQYYMFHLVDIFTNTFHNIMISKRTHKFSMFFLH
ncbi:hypothetical protein V1527DRAFT_81474 [Lipomyces starkeyi]